MLSKFLEGLGGKLAERWVATMLTPAFVFWVGGLGAWVYRFGWTPLETWIASQTQPVQAVLLVCSLLGVGISAVVVQSFDLAVLRFLEGYWPGCLRPLRRCLRRWQASRLDRAEQRFQALAGRGLQHLTPEELDEYVALDWRLMHVPAAPEQRMPTALGNVLRAAERRSADKYGLDAIICWPRLWLLLPDSVRNELAEARAALDTSARLWLWGILFVVWSVWAWWAVPVGLLAACYAYRGAQGAAEVYGTLLESAFDLYRTVLYNSLRWPLPANPAEERQRGEQLTTYLWRGSDTSCLVFSAPPAEKPS